MKDNICPLCGAACKTQLSTDYTGYTYVNCKKCGRFLIHESVYVSFNPADLVQSKKDAAVMILNPQIEKKRYNAIFEFLLKKPYYNIMGMEYYYRFFYEESYIIKDTDPQVYVNVADLMKNYPKNVGEKLDKILMNFSILYPTAGTVILYDNVPDAAMYIEFDDLKIAIDEKLMYLEYLNELGYFNKSSYKLTAKGWARIAELTVKQNEINQGFIAMSFCDETKSISDSFKTAINDCGYSPKRIDEKEHNNQIVPEIFHEIEQSKFVVVDVTYQNYGAYYEAGYAQALGKQVIICCRKTEFDNPQKRPHFDISQKSMIVWGTDAELIERLKKRIEATVGINKQRR